MKRFFLLTLLIFVVAFFFPAPRAGAMDPVTIALLAPVAISAAQKAQPYVVRGFSNGWKGMVAVGKDMIDIFRLPLGVFEATLGAPFGFFGAGVKNIVIGCVAPFKMTVHILILPVLFCGFQL